MPEEQDPNLAVREACSSGLPDPRCLEFVREVAAGPGPTAARRPLPVDCVAMLRARALRRAADEIRADFGADGYACYHAPRYAVALELVRPFVDPGRSRVLDIGPSKLTELLRDRFDVIVDSLGFAADGATATGRHYRFDLNSAQHEERWRTDLPAYDLVVFAEVLEHLHTSPRLVLGYLRSLLTPSGVLLLQTPNAVALTKRIKMLAGRHPYERIREDATNPGHFRESTANELEEYAALAGFEVLHRGHYNYFDFRFSGHAGASTPRWIEATKYALFDWVPPRLRSGISLVLRPSDAEEVAG